MEECASPTQAHSSIIITLYGRDYPFRACRPNLADALVGAHHGAPTDRTIAHLWGAPEKSSPLAGVPWYAPTSRRLSSIAKLKSLISSIQFKTI